jgi:hypothetical protein
VGSTVFYPGAAELATLSNTFSVSGVATDPTTVTLVVTDPTGDATTYTQAGGDFTHVGGTGLYSIDIACTEVGTWSFVWTGTGAASDIQAGTWDVTSAPASDLYCTPDALKSRTGIADSLDDREILGVCRSVSRWIDEYCDRVFARRTVTVQLEPCGYYSVTTPDLVSVTTLKTDNDADGVFETTWSAADYELQPVNAALEVQPRPYTAIAAVGSQLFPIAATGYGRRARAQLAGVFGWPSIPSPVAEAAGIFAADYLANTGMKFGVLGFDGYAVRARLSSPALEMLRPYRKYAVLMA